MNQIWFTSIFKNIVEFPTKLSILLPYDPAVVLLGIYTKELKTYAHIKNVQTNIYSNLFIIAKTLMEPRYSSVSEWISCGTSRQWNIIHSKNGNKLPIHEKT